MSAWNHILNFNFKLLTEQASFQSLETPTDRSDNDSETSCGDNEDRINQDIGEDDDSNGHHTKKMKLTETIEYTLTVNENNFWAETIDNKVISNDDNDDSLVRTGESSSSSNNQKEDNIEIMDNFNNNPTSSSSSQVKLNSYSLNSSNTENENENDEEENSLLGGKKSKKRRGKLLSNPNNLSRNIPMGPIDEEGSFNFDKRCLLKYFELHGDMRVRHTFEIPWNSNWCEEMWGYKLGNQTRRIREFRIHLDKKDELINLGFSYKKLLAREGYGWERIKSSLLQYKSLYGNLLVHRDFVVPSNNSDWPEKTWGIRLGSRVHHLRNRGDHADKRNELLDMGFVFRVSKLSKFAIKPI